MFVVFIFCVFLFYFAFLFISTRILRGLCFSYSAQADVVRSEKLNSHLIDSCVIIKIFVPKVLRFGNFCFKLRLIMSGCFSAFLFFTPISLCAYFALGSVETNVHWLRWETLLSFDGKLCQEYSQQNY